VAIGIFLEHLINNIGNSELQGLHLSVKGNV